MLSFKGIIDFLNDPQRKCCERVLRWRNVYYDMSLHVDGACPAYKDLTGKGWVFPTNYFGEWYQWIFENRLYSKHPREHVDQRNWRLSQHRPFTQQPFLQVIQVLMGAIFQDSGYSIDIQNKDDADYIWGNNFEGKNLVGYISEKFQNICVDPNGVFVVIPKEPYYKTTTDKVEPKIVWIPSRFIEYRTDEEIIFNYDNLMWCMNTYGIFRFEKRKNTLTGEDEFVSVDGVSRGYYGHMLLRSPNHVGGGIWNTQGFYESWLHSAKAWADEFVSNKSAEQLVNKEASHPYIVEPSEECPQCDAGQQVSCRKCGRYDRECECGDQADMFAHKCSSCGGTSTKSRNPGDHLSVPMEDLKGAGASDLIKFISPDIKINEYHAKNNKAIFDELYRSLYLNYIDQAQSALAKDRDMQARYQFFLTVSDDLFGRLIPALLNDILSMRNVRVEDGELRPYAGDFEIVKPKEFQVKSSYDLLFEYDLAFKAKVPDYVLGKQLKDFNDKQFGGDDVLKAKTAFIIQDDPLALKDADTKQIELTNGIITREQWVYSLNLPFLLDTVIRTYSRDWFLRAEYDEIKPAVMTAFAAVPIPEAPTDLKIIDQNKV